MALFAVAMLIGVRAHAADQVRIESGAVEGTASADGKVRIFKGISYTAPPVGDLRWRPPEPALRWTGVKKTSKFGARCMQPKISDMVFRDGGPSEDCLYLNVWTPAKSAEARLPVMVWIYGGGFNAGSASEARQDGEKLAEKGVVVVSFNYRLGIFGFMSNPALTKESGHGASGNYGLLDQIAALQWVRKNIAVFGGDAGNVTIFGESAGSFSVSALMASPLGRDLFQRAIGESGAFFGRSLATKSRSETEADGSKFADALGAQSLVALRAKSAADLQAAETKKDAVQFAPNVDGYFLPESVWSIYASGKQSHVPLLAGWNANELGYQGFFQNTDPTAKNFIERARLQFGDRADQFLKLYPADSDAQAKQSAEDFSGDVFIAYSTWKWIETHASTSGATVFRYEFDDAPPPPAGQASRGAYHTAEIEFVFESLQSTSLPWRRDDEKLSELMAAYWTNFAKTGDPNRTGLPQWPAYDAGNKFQVMHLSFASHAEPDAHRSRYEFLDTLILKK